MFRRVFLFFALLVSVPLFACAAGGGDAPPFAARNETGVSASPTRNGTAPETKPPVPRSLRLMATGDILIHGSVRNAAALPEGGYDFTPFFEYVTPLFKQADLVMGNLENPLAGTKSGYTGYPVFNAPDQLAANLKTAGFTALTLANNHALDRGWTGLLRTIAVVEAAGLEYMGAYQSAADKTKRMVREIKGIKVGFLAYTYGVNDNHVTPPGEEWRLGFIDAAAIRADMAAARKAGAEFIILTLHFGHEYHRKPWPAQTTLVKELFAPITPLEPGADLIIGHHPHVVQTFARIPTDNAAGTAATQAVIYSLGNFLSNQKDRYTYIGLILDCTLTIGADGRKSLDNIALVPTYCRKRPEGPKGKLTYRILPLADAVKNPKAYGLTAPVAAGMMGKDLDEITRHVAGLDTPPAQKAIAKPTVALKKKAGAKENPKSSIQKK